MGQLEDAMGRLDDTSGAQSYGHERKGRTHAGEGRIGADRAIRADPCLYQAHQNDSAMAGRPLLLTEGCLVFGYSCDNPQKSINPLRQQVAS